MLKYFSEINIKLIVFIKRRVKPTHSERGWDICDLV